VVIDGYQMADCGTLPLNIRWEVGRQGERLLVALGGSLAGFSGEQQERFAEAVARSVTPGQVTG
jgi:hypothetical protein